MELPRTIPYNASWKGMAFGSLFFGMAAVVMGDKALHNDRALIFEGIELGPGGATIFYWIICAGASAFILMALLSLWRRLFHPKSLELGNDVLVLPHGFLQKKIERIPYSEIHAVQEQTVSRQRFFYLFTPKGRFAMVSGLFPDKQSYVEVRDFLIALLGHAPGQARTRFR